MKKRLLLLLLCALMLLLLVSCKAERYDLLHSQEIDGITYCVRGKKDNAKQIVVKEGDMVLWAQKIKTDASVGNLNETFGFEVLDLNFDGQLDLMIAQKAEGELITYLCWLKNAEGDGYTASEELSGLINIKTDERLKAVFSFSRETRREQEYGDAEAYDVTTDTATKYLWEDGSLVPEMRAAITYYPKADRYCYSLSFYDETAKQFGDSNDKWLTAEQYQKEDMGFLYYFR